MVGWVSGGLGVVSMDGGRLGLSPLRHLLPHSEATGEETSLCIP